MKSSLIFALLITLHSGAFSPACAGEVETIDPLWLNRVVEECNSKYIQYLAATAKITEQSESLYEKDPNDTSSIPYTRKTLYRNLQCLGDSSILESSMSIENNTEPLLVKISVDNPDYSFTLHKSSTGNIALISQFPRSFAGAGNRTYDMADALHTEAYMPIKVLYDAATNVANHKLLQLNNDPDKQLLHAKFSSPAAEAGKQIVQDVWLDPKNDWRIVSTIKKTPNATVYSRMTFATAKVLDLSFLSTYYQRSTFTFPGIPSQLIHGKITKLAVTTRLPSDFYLSAFGVPEPIGFKPPPSPNARLISWVYMAFGVSLSLGLLFACLWRRSHRLKSMRTPTGTAGS